MIELLDNSKLHLGLDIGATSIKDAVVSGGGQVLYLDKEPYRSQGTFAATEVLIERLKQQFTLNDIATAGVTGRGKDFYKGQVGWQAFTSAYAVIEGLRLNHPDARTIIVIGGQGSLVIGLEGKSWRVAVSPLCAAGTGRFLEQQAKRLETTIEEFGDVALEWIDQPPRIASRCSVFAKSDLVHLQQKGWPLSAMLAGLSDSVARMIESQWRDGFVSPVYLVGGVAANKGVVRALSNVLKVEPIVPTSYQNQEAIGAALLSKTASNRPEDFYPKKNSNSQVFYVPNNLKPVGLSREWQQKELDPGITDVYLGVDVGSTSTKIVIINSEGEVLAKKYIMTAGQPLKAIQEIMSDEGIAKLEERLNVKAVGVTGSGRYLVGHFIGADLIKNEITAQTRAAKHIDPEVTTIIELGGQDSKFVSLRNGTVVDFQMNKACAAGTGSFIDELVEQLGVSTRNGEFARLAFSAERRLELGEKCAAFMGQAVAVAQQEGVALEEIIASLTPSLEKNYLSKVVGKCRIGERVILTGAVPYNEAVVAAFKAALPGKEFIIPEHKEVTGAIGAALLAKEAMPEEAESNFKGFSSVAKETYKLTYFNCNACEQSCAISSMVTGNGRKLFYGSRCDRFDAEGTIEKTYEKPATAFTDREALLFENYDPEKGSGLTVGVPRALMSYDMAPMLTGFLNALGVRVLYSSQTSKGTIELSSKHAYPDSCLPIKLLHGHVAKLLEMGVDRILIPSAIRLGEKTGEKDQRYACPLVQAAPYITKSVFGLGDRLLDPVIDFSRGEDAVIKSFINIAKRLGFSEKEGKLAIKEGLAMQRQFEAKLQEQGKRLLEKLADNPNNIGVVLLSRSYNAQDSGANLGMTDALYKLGVIPIPMDYLPLKDIDISDITDRPYWSYERKIYAATKFTATHPQLFGLFLSNFGCGPNSFILSPVEDIMSNKPLVQIEVDEHAAEAGIITRLEAGVDAFRGHRKKGFKSDLDPQKYGRRSSSGVGLRRSIFIPPMADHAYVIAGGMRGFGVDAQVLPDSGERTMVLSRDVTNGNECLPFRHSLGAMLAAAEDGILSKNDRVLMAGAYGPCRLGKYSQEQQKILDERGIPVEVLTSVSNNSYADLGLGNKFELMAWKGIAATDLLQRMLWTTRPYEKQLGETNRAYGYYLEQLVKHMEENKGLGFLLREASGSFSELKDHSLEKRPLVGINGEIYLRANSYCNQYLVEACEAEGLEVEVAPMTEWIKYMHLRRTEDAWLDKDFGKLAKGWLRQFLTEHYEKQVASFTDGIIHGKEPSPADLVRASSEYLLTTISTEAVLSIGSGVLQMKDPKFAAVASVGPRGCMPGGIVANFAQQISLRYGKPWISFTYDGFADTVNSEQVAAFAEQIRSRSS